MAAVPWRPGRWGVRTRSAVAAALVVGVAFGAASLALLWVLQRSLQSAADGTAGARADQIAQRLLESAPTDLDRALLATDSRTTVVQIVSAGGAVVLSSPQAPATPISAATPSSGEQVRLGRSDNTTQGGDYRVTARGVSGTYGAFTVLVGAGQDPIDATLTTVGELLALGWPVLVLVSGGATFALVGRSLRPVERMRARVATIDSTDLSERVPVPASGDEIARLALTMNGMLTRVEAGHRAQRRFVGDASHELRSPLATVTAGLELARDRPEVFDRALLEQTLLPEAERMQALVEDLLLLAKADERGLSLRVSDVDLDDIVAAEASRVRALGAVAVTSAAHPARLRGDPARVARVVRNLTENAVRHAHTSVRLGSTVVGDCAVLTVADDGPGIAPAERSRVFERFVRLDTDRARAAGGSGLGLAIVAEIVTAHGGAVSVTDAAEGGAEFRVRLPLR